MAEPYVRTEFKIVADIDGTKFEDVVAISATFGLNSIPTASLQVAVGKNVITEQPATIHQAIYKLKPRSPAKVTLTVKTNDGQTNKMLPDGTYVIFEGYYAGVGYQRGHTNATCTLHLLHWLDDLNCSSMLNGNWFQGAPHDMAQSASAFSLRAGGGGETNISPVLDSAPTIVTKSNMETDLWGAVIKPIFFAVANMSHPNEQGDGNTTGAAASGYGGGDNKAAQDALEKIPGNAPVPGKLPMNLTGLEEITFSHNVNMGLSHMLLNGIAYSSFWGKTIGELGSAFLFGISPGVTFANAIPYFGGLSTEYKTIEPDEYNYASFNCSVANLIESVDIYYSQQASSGYMNGGKVPTPMSYYRPWGRYPDSNQDFRGNILVRDPPIWIANCTPHAHFSPRTTLEPGSDPMVPQTGSGDTPNGTKRAPEAEKEIKESGLMNRFCEHWFKSAVLGQRNGEMSGKFRLDIAPGSTIKIMAATNEMAGSDLPLYATVTQVSFVINSEQHAAGTSFSLINIRNSEENKNNKLVSAIPPLYKVAWKGGPLIDKM